MPSLTGLRLNGEWHWKGEDLMPYLFEDKGENVRGDSQVKMCVAEHANDLKSSPCPQAC